MLPTKFRYNWLSSFKEEDFKKSTNLKQELPVAAMFVNESRDEMSNRGPSIDASYQISFQLAKQFQGRFLEINQSETRIACGNHVC